MRCIAMQRIGLLPQLKESSDIAGWGASFFTDFF
jgi:hypothetical protein